MTDRLNHIDEKIHQLKKKREKVQAQQALSFLKETQKIFKDEFSTPLALAMMAESWAAAPETKKESWKKAYSLGGGKPQTFPSPASQLHRKKNQEVGSTDHQSREKEIPHHEHT
ncbi:MAG: hypothetical protein BGO67_10445 [Alphaproteobacteria bacterium 41-28]|nr:MAG: hypothetical protein BGO67_10445 [Alphaproteobacteria bacterium 41-28]